MTQICFNANVDAAAGDLGTQAIEEFQAWFDAGDVERVAVLSAPAGAGGDAPSAWLVRCRLKDGREFHRRFDEETPERSEWHARHWLAAWQKQNLGR
jgi:hypothetical protein